MITKNILKDGKRHAVTVSYDDGSTNDRQLIEIFNRYGIHGTFHLNSSSIVSRRPWNVSPDELPTLYAGHEVACHGVTHASCAFLDQTALIHEMFEDRKNLEAMIGYPVRGLSYANGSYTEETLQALRTCGIVYSRTTKDTGGFAFPTENFLTWHPTCHQRDSVQVGERFIKALDGYYSGPKLLYVWGHSHEFERSVKWETIETFCKTVSGRDDVWYATNIEIYDYVQALKALVISADHTMVWNPSCMEVWFSCDGQVCSVKPGEIWKK